VTRVKRANTGPEWFEVLGFPVLRLALRRTLSTHDHLRSDRSSKRSEGVPAFGLPLFSLNLLIKELVQNLNLGPIWQASDSLSPRAPGSARRPFLKFAPEPCELGIGRTFQTSSQQIRGANPLRGGIYRGYDKVWNTDDAEGRQLHSGTANKRVRRTVDTPQDSQRVVNAL